MADWVRYGLVAFIVFLTHFQEGITGFGCVALALPFVTLLLGLDVAVPVLVMVGWLLAVLLVLESRRKIVWAEFGRIIVFVGIGIPFGIWGAGHLPEDTLKWVLAAFMVAVGSHGLVNQLRGVSHAPKMHPRTRLLTGSLMPLSGVVHGAFGAGGPLLVVYAARALTDKTVFRVTLCMVWVVLNGVLIGQWAVTSRLTPYVWKLTALCVPFMLIGLFLGNHAHYRINELTFRKVVYSVLIASGCVLVYSLVA